MKKADELVRYRKMQKNIEAAMDAVSLCLPGKNLLILNDIILSTTLLTCAPSVLEKYSKLEEQMELKRYLPML